MVPARFQHADQRFHRPCPTGSLLSRKVADPLDGPAFVTGCLSLLRQFHSHNTDQFLGYMGQYVRSMVHTQIGAK